MGALGGSLGTSWALLGGSWALGGLLEGSLEALGATLEAIRAILEASWMVLKPSSKRFGNSWVQIRAQRSFKVNPRRSQIDLLRRLELKLAKPQKLSTVRRISMICDVPRALLGAKVATKSGLGPLESRFEPSWGSWRLSEGSWRRLGALLEARGARLECFKRGAPHRRELEESSRRGQGEIRQRPGEG